MIYELVGMNGTVAVLDGKTIVVSEDGKVLFTCACRRNWKNIAQIAETMGLAAAVVDNAIGVATGDQAYLNF